MGGINFQSVLDDDLSVSLLFVFIQAVSYRTSHFTRWLYEETRIWILIYIKRTYITLSTKRELSLTRTKITTLYVWSRLYEAALPQDGPHQQHISGGQTTGARSGIKTNVRTNVLF